MYTARALAAAATAAAAVAWIGFFRSDLVLSHYDAKAHLVVARRVIDNLTPGWQQFGAVWLPLPHLIHFLPTQIDWLYRTGLFGSLISIACFGVTAYAAARLVGHITGSPIGAATSTCLLALNPNLLYLHATPMTEPIAIAATFLTVLWLYEWAHTNADEVPRRLRLALFVAVWTRYEAWLVLGAALPAALFVRARAGAPRGALVRRAVGLGIWPTAAVVLFLINSRITSGSWLVTGGFFVPDPAYEGQLGRSLLAVWWGTHQLSARTTELVALVVAVVCLVRGFTRGHYAALLLPVALLAAAALPTYALYEGHPFRIRYMVPLVAAAAVLGGIGVGMPHRAARAREHERPTHARMGGQPPSRLRRFGAPRRSLGEGGKASGYHVPASRVLAGVLVGSTLLQSPPWRADAPMLIEAQWDRPASKGRERVTACLSGTYRGELILASMGSLAHYMQELTRAGLAIADFVHEGNGVIWELALETGPAPHAGWMLVEDEAEGGDVLAQRIRQNPAFTRGMSRVCAGGGVALYRRD